MILTMRWKHLIASAVVAVSIPSLTTAQGTATGCPSSALSRFDDWMAVAAGATCSALEAAKLTVKTGDLVAQFSNQSQPVLILSGGSLPWYFLPGFNPGNSWNPWGGGTPCLPFYTPWTPVCTNPNTIGNSGGNSDSGNNDGDNDNQNDIDDTGNPGNDDTGTPGDDIPPSTPPGDNLNELVNESNSTPEPATLLLVASGLGGVGALARRRKAARKPDDR